jgi:hypothetical protein
MEAIEEGEISITGSIYDKSYNKDKVEKSNVHKDNGTETAELNIYNLLDADFDGEYMFNDIILALDILSGNVENNIYNVTMDVDKDGVLTMKDLATAYDYLVGAITADEIFVMGITDEIEREFWEEMFGLTLDFECTSKFCSYSSNDAFVYCPACGTKRDAQ